MKRIPDDGAFRNPQSFTLLTADHLLDKLRWDMAQLEQLRWNEDLVNWRQIISYKAVECATSSWHLADWFFEDIRATEQRERVREFLKLGLIDPWGPAFSQKREGFGALRKAAKERCPDLEVCRVVAIATKHYEVNDKPRPDIRTSAYLSTAYRDNEYFQRPVMWLAAFEGNEKRDMREVFQNCLRFWEEFNYVASPGSAWQVGDQFPKHIYHPIDKSSKKKLPFSRRDRPWSVQRLYCKLSKAINKMR